MLKHTFLTLFLILFLILFIVAFIVIPGQELGIAKAKYANFTNCLAKAANTADQELCARVYK